MTQYDHFRNPPHRRLGALGIVRNSAGGVLMLKMEPERNEAQRPWHHPGGCVEANERISDALVRVARNKLGVTLTPGRLLAVHHMHDEVHGQGDSQWLSKEGVNFLFDCGTVDFGDSGFTFGPRVIDVRYVMPEEFDGLLSPFTAARTRAALRAVDGAPVEMLVGHPDR